MSLEAETHYFEHSVSSWKPKSGSHKIYTKAFSLKERTNNINGIKWNIDEVFFKVKSLTWHYETRNL